MDSLWETGEIKLAENVWGEGETYLAKELKNDSRLLKKPLCTNIKVPASIHNEKYFDFWAKVLKVDLNFQKFLKQGYVIPFENGNPPPSSMTKNNKSFLKNKEFGIQEIIRLEKLGCIYRVEKQPKIVLPLSVVYSGKWRLVVDASRHLNPYLEKRHVKLETLDDAELQVQKGDYQAVSDLDSGYWHILLHEVSQPYVGVHYVDKEGIVHFFQWRVLFLGLSDAVRLFTKVLKPIRAHLHRQGIRHNFYIDDMRVLGDSKNSCEKNNNFALHVLQSAGWVVKQEKCISPTQSARYLGQISDLEKMLYFCPEI